MNSTGMFRVIHLRDFAVAAVVASVTGLCLSSCEQNKAKADSQVALGHDMADPLRVQVAYLIDRQQIQDVYMRYMRGFDRNDVELMRSAFWPDVQINYGSQLNTFNEFVSRHLNQHTATLDAWQHLLTNETVNITGDVAHVEIYVTRLSNGKGESKSKIVSGRYIDRVERRNGEWRIAVREFIPRFWTETEGTLDTFVKRLSESGWSTSTCGMGTLDKRDPSYKRPLNSRASRAVGPDCAE